MVNAAQREGAPLIYQYIKATILRPASCFSEKAESYGQTPAMPIMKKARKANEDEM
jgi:hypothetical protein